MVSPPALEGSARPARGTYDFVLAAFVTVLLISNIAFARTLPDGLLWSIIVSNYLFRVGFEALATPLTCLAANRLKSVEGVDVLEASIGYNPFRLSEQA